MDIISYNQFEIDSYLNRLLIKSGFDKNAKLTRYISKITVQYDRYKESYNFPTKYKGRNNFKTLFFNLNHFRIQFCLQTSLYKDKF